MPSPSLKLIASLIGVGGASVGIYSYLNKSNNENNQVQADAPKGKIISEWLDSDNLVLLSESAQSDEAAWKTKWGIFVDANTSQTTLDKDWNIQSWATKKNNKQEVPLDFKTNCINNSKIRIEKKEGDKYEKVKEYCTKAKPER